MVGTRSGVRMKQGKVDPLGHPGRDGIITAAPGTGAIGMRLSRGAAPDFRTTDRC